MKFRTGDLFLAKKWTLDSLFNHLIDQRSSWTDVGIFEVNNDTEIFVFMMTIDGAKKIAFEQIMKDPTLQSAAYRELTNRNRALFYLSIKAMIESLTDSPKENIGILIDEYKGKPVERTGYTSAELVGKILDKVGLMRYKDGILLSNYETGGILDDHYGKDFPLFPVNNISNRELEVINKAKNDSTIIISQFMEHNPLMAVSKHKPRLSVEEIEKVNEVKMPAQLANNIIENKAKTNIKASTLSSEALTQKLLRMNHRDRPKPGTKVIPK